MRYSLQKGYLTNDVLKKKDRFSARANESTWHTAPFYPSREVNIDRHNNNCLPVVYKMSSITISRNSKMCACRQIFVIWDPIVDDANGHYSLWCSELNCKISTILGSPRGTPMKTEFLRLCSDSRYMYTTTRKYDTSLKCYCCDSMATVTSARIQISTTVKLLCQRAFCPKWSDDDP